MSFVVFTVEDKQHRLRLEEAIISVLNHEDEFKQSSNWLGNSSPEPEIRKSGLWLKRGLKATPLTREEFKYIKDSIKEGGAPSTALIEVPIQSSSTNQSKKSEQFIPVKQPGRDVIRAYIRKKFEQCRLNGARECTLVSGDIHRSMGLNNKMPSVCGVMYQLMNPRDEVLHSTPSGKSSTIKIKYYL